MLDRLSDTFNGLFRKLSGNATISESNVRDAMADVRTSLLEADVNAEVVEKFCQQVMTDAVGRQVAKSLRPGEEMIYIVHKRLIELLGGDPEAPSLIRGDLHQTAVSQLPAFSAPEGGIMRVSPGPTIIMMCGLQGSGKTTTCGKLAGYLKKRGRSVMLAAADLQRPAAVDQLHTIADQVRDEMGGGASVSFYAEADKCAEYGKAVGVAVGVCQRALEAARKQGVDTLILDTAGRLHINDDLMGELGSIKRMLQPHHIFLVVDAMTGQDAVNSARAFHQRLEVDGVIMTKFDSDTRGGAALSVKQVTGAPIKFVGVGEKLDAIEEFFPERFAGRILGMGDVVSLVEKIQTEVKEEEAEALQKKMARGEMTMDDFLGQMRTLRRMGPLKQILGLLPGVGGALKDLNIDEKQLDGVEAMINSMTKKERGKPDVIDNSRRKRIATGAGVQQNEVGQLVKQFGMVSKLSKQMAGLTAREKVSAMKDFGSAGSMSAADAAAAMSAMRGKGGSFTPSVKRKFKKRK
jgi:signal recognition particle subunit SRP54